MEHKNGSKTDDAASKNKSLAIHASAKISKVAANKVKAAIHGERHVEKFMSTKSAGAQATAR